MEPLSDSSGYLMKHIRSVNVLGIIVATTIFLTACASSSEPSALQKTQKGAAEAAKKTTSGLGRAVQSPLNDLNVQRDKIPSLLANLKTPYELAGTCEEISNQVIELDKLIGPDIDEPKLNTRDGGTEAGGQIADAGLGAIAGAASGFIPFRGVVRSVSGAKKHEMKMMIAYRRGIERRAYLKGVGKSKGCEYPAAPRE